MTDQMLADDMLKTAKNIGLFIGENERRTFYLLENKLLPGYKMGGLWYARKSSLRRRIEELEEAASG